MPELESLQSVFKNRLFRIPDYQRGYAWTTVQLKDFWDDLVNLPSDREHYTGLLTLKKVDRLIWQNWNSEEWIIAERDYKPLYIVDGQQRLTTFVVFIQALTELTKSLEQFKGKDDAEIIVGSYSLASIREEYLVVQKPGAGIIRTHKFGYESDNPSFRFLRHKILGEPGGGSIQETFYTLNLDNAKRFFAENLQRFYSDNGFSQIEILFRKVTHNLKFNLYEIGDDFDVFVAFETMNNRGKKLSNLELLKNRLIYLTTLYTEDQLSADDRRELREKINDAWKEIYHQLGRNKEKPLSDDDFLVAHWIMYFQYSRQKGDDYIKFLLQEHFTPQNVFSKTDASVETISGFEEITESDAEPDEPDDEGSGSESAAVRSKIEPSEIDNYVTSLKSAALHWYNTHNPDGSPELTVEEKLWVDRLNRIGIGYFRPLVTASFVAPHISSEERVALFRAIERFLFVEFRMGRAFATYRNSEFYRLTRRLLKGRIGVKDLVDVISERISGSFYRPDDESVDEQYFNYDPFVTYLQRKFQSGLGFYGWNGLRYFLYEYEMEKVRNRGSAKIDWLLFVKGDKDKVSIEHILPQVPEGKCWKDALAGIKKREIKYLQGSLGNLVPLSRSINSSLQNDCFQEKKNPKFNELGEKVRQGYQDGSHSEIEVAGYSKWDARSVLKRGIELLNFMERRWDLKFESEDAKKELLFLEFIS